MRMKLGDFCEINPRVSLKKGQVAKKIAMTDLPTFGKAITNYTLEEYKGGTKFQNGDTLMARITPCLENGKGGYVDILDDGEVAFGSTEYIVFRGKLEVSDSQFLYYFINTTEFREIAIKSMTGTSGRQRVQTDLIANMEFDFPELKEQRKIAEILCQLDEKIKLNNKLNENLENYIALVYKQWFVNYDYPNAIGELKESELGLIPKEWEVADLYSILDIIYGAPYKSKLFNNAREGYPLVRIRDLKTYEPQFWTNELLPKTEFVLPGDILAGMDAEFRATVWKADKSLLNQRVCKFVPKNLDIPLSFICEHLKPVLAFYENAKVGTTVIHIGKKDFDSAKIVCPPLYLMKSFGQVTMVAYQLIVARALENRNLQKLRDILLTKLMNGEVDLNEM